MSIYRNTAFLIILIILSLSCRRKENVDPIVSDDKTAVEKTNTNKDEIIPHYSVKENEKITNKEYQELNKISTRTAAYELKELVEEYKIFKMLGASVNKFYMLINS